MKRKKLHVLFLISTCCFLACKPSREQKTSVIFGNGGAPDDTVEVYDLPQIQEAGTLSGVTLSGPDTYYEYRGQGFGVQFTLAEEFSRTVRAVLRMEIAPDTAALFAVLSAGQARPHKASEREGHGSTCGAPQAAPCHAKQGERHYQCV